MKTPKLILSFVTMSLLTIAGLAQAATAIVTNSADSGVGSLRQAISDAASGDTINFAAGIATINLTSGELLIDKDLTINGPGPNLLTLQRSASATTNFRIFAIAANSPSNNVTISGLTITNGHTTSNGGGIRNFGTLALTNATISGNSAGSYGGGIYNSMFNSGDTVTITNSTISGNSAVSGGGIYNDGTVTITNSTISGNSAVSGDSGGGGGGGIDNYNGAVTLTNSTIAANTADFSGGGIDNYGGTVNAKSTIIALNTADLGSPDVYGALTSQGYNLIGDNSGASITPLDQPGDQIGSAGSPKDPVLGPLQDNGGPTKTQALLYGSTAIDKGKYGGSSTDQRGYTRPVDLSTISNAFGGDGNDIGAYEVQANDLPAGCNVANSVVKNTNDSGTDSLRAVIANVCTGATIRFAANVRGAIDLTSAELLINKSLTIVGPGANILSVQRSAASGIPEFRIFDIVPSINVTISGLTIANGSATGFGYGGGIFNQGTLTITNTTISGNVARVGYGEGGGIYTGDNHNGTLTIINSTISGNMAADDSYGGGIVNETTLTVTNSTISGNTVGGTGWGGGIYTYGPTVTITNSTIAGNSADEGGGIRQDGSTINSKNTIIAKNTATTTGPDMYGTLTSGGYNLIGNASGVAITPANHTGDQIGVTAAKLNLGPLQDNGGTTQTHALLSGSFAIDKGNSSGLSTDQRGFTRPVDLPAILNAGGGDGSDIGAFEFGGTPAPAPSAQLSNVSTRVRVLTGDKVLIGGFIVTGSTPKKVIIRAIGPSLASFGVTGALADPILELHEPGNIVVTNDNWKTTQQAAIQAAGIAPKNDRESAIVATLAPGSYTAIVRGKNNGIGVGLVEAYDLDQAAASQLGNISTRGFVDTGDNVMIGGIIVGPTGAPSGKMLIRAIGPSLASFGIAGPLADPTLELHNGNGVLTASNDNWKTSQQALIQATGIPPTNDKESAILATLAPGNYTAIVRGKNNTTGVALVEVYSLK